MENIISSTCLSSYLYDGTNFHTPLAWSLFMDDDMYLRFLENYEDGEATIRQFHDFTRLFEGLHQAIDAGGSVFHDCLNEVEKILIQNGLKEYQGDTNLPEQTQ